MCRLHYLFDVKKEGCVAYVYEPAGIKDGQDAYDESLKIARSGLVNVELFVVSDPATSTVCHVSGKRTDYAVPAENGNKRKGPYTYSVYGQYDGTIVCLSFRHYPDIPKPYVFSILTGAKDKDVIGRVADSLSNI